MIDSVFVVVINYFFFLDCVLFCCFDEVLWFEMFIVEEVCVIIKVYLVLMKYFKFFWKVIEVVLDGLSQVEIVYVVEEVVKEVILVERG